MELKNYQQQVIKDIEQYLVQLKEHGNILKFGGQATTKGGVAAV